MNFVSRMRRWSTLWLMVILAVVLLLGAAERGGCSRRRQVNVGVVLDLGTWLGQLGLSCINMALSDFNSNSNSNTTLVLHTRDSNRDIVMAAEAALDLIRNVGVEAIIGTQNSMQAPFVIALGQKSQVPIISFSATSPSLTSLRSPYFFRATQNDSSQVRAVSALVAAFRWPEAVPVYSDNDFGAGIVPYLIDALQEVNARVPCRSAIPTQASDDQITAELHKLMTMQTRVFVVHMNAHLGARVFAKAKEIGMMSGGCVWIMTTGITDTWTQINGDDDLESMQGVLGVRTYVPQSNKLRSFTQRFQHQNPSNLSLDTFGLWAYDASLALSHAIQKQNRTPDGPGLAQTLSSTRFQGLTGEYGFIDRQIQSPAFQIINVNGNGIREVGVWTTVNGLVRRFNLASTETAFYSTSKDNLGPIIWPGDSTSVPRGWEVPMKGKKLRILVPGKRTIFVTITRDHETNRTYVTGYCIDIFKAVIEAMPYPVSYEFVPFLKDNDIAGTYDDMINQVYLRKYDGVVGDITITNNRSQYVDFTLPYEESGVAMLVPIKDQRPKNAWVFLRPLTPSLWAASGCFFVFIGFVVWALEHRGNPHFRGPWSHQLGTSLWFAFSTMVFAHREKVFSSLARTVVMIWCFVVLILTQSYTASLTSLLTVQQLQPTVTDVQQLLKSRAYVGYQRASFVYDVLKNMGFEPEKLRAYTSRNDLEGFLSNGSIAAAVGEIPYLKLFVQQSCNKYTILDRVIQTGGFGYVFPVGSPLVPDISRAILNITQDIQKMNRIRNAWFSNEEGTCSDLISNSVSSDSLGLHSFWGLFLIAGAASISALLVSVATFLFQHRDDRMFHDSDASFVGKLQAVLRIFDTRDMKSPAFMIRKRHDEDHDHAEQDHVDHGNASPESNDHVLTSPSSYTGDMMSTGDDTGTPSPEHLEVAVDRGN